MQINIEYFGVFIQKPFLANNKGSNFYKRDNEKLFLIGSKVFLGEELDRWNEGKNK